MGTDGNALLADATAISIPRMTTTADSLKPEWLRLGRIDADAYRKARRQMHPV